jgi:ABC-type multidrug transport system ATPase subunit
VCRQSNRYAAELRLPRDMDPEERERRVDQALFDMGLAKTRDTVR